MSALTALSPGAARVYDSINAAPSPDILDNMVRAIWHDWGKGLFNDDEATFLAGAIERRRPISFHRPSHAGGGPCRPIGRLLGRLGSRFNPRRPQRSPDRAASRQRRRTLAGSSALPPGVRWRYTEGERAALSIVASEVKRCGLCEWPIDKIAATAGVCRTTVQNALREARLQAHVSVEERPVKGRKNLTNAITITSREWLAWLKRGPSVLRSIGFKMFDPTKNIDRRKLSKKDEFDEETSARGRGPPHEPLRRCA
jgi:hypothetical protein